MKRLLRLLSDGGFCSGQWLADELGISRTSIWKKIDGLSSLLGLEIHAVPGRGYRLTRPLELLDETRIRNALAVEVQEKIGAFFIHDRIDSTNLFLKARSSEAALQGAICLAESQTAGRGRRGRPWISPFGNNVYLSLAWQYPGEPASLSGLSLAVGVAVVRALSASGVPDLGLKWPNDIVWAGKKLGGILIELSGEAQGPCHVVIGLGLNYKMSPDEGRAIDQDWVDLDTIRPTAKPGRNSLVAALINEIVPLVSEYDRTGLAPYLAEWRSLDCLLGKEIVLHTGTQEFAGSMAGIDEHGLIRLHTAGRIRSFASGEVSLHRDPV
ncbi:MAG: bifunctional biotin--[acetyl-CoA-carboxylase] ligase/biotin operon repressor BirA [Gammaproteobacteria bacterium]